jgi:Rieske Fe-S protein
MAAFGLRIVQSPQPVGGRIKGWCRDDPVHEGADRSLAVHHMRRTPATRPGRRSPNKDEGGVVSGPPWHLEARCRVDGTEHRVSPVCPHLGGIVNWNDADKAWECPLHGSRFAPDGTLLEGPATRDLTASP